MAKKSVNKTKLIKEAMASNPEATPKQIADDLAKYGVTPQYVSTVKFNMNKKGLGVGRSTTRRGPIGTSGRGTRIELSDLVKAKDLADQVGGVQKAKEVLDALSKLT